MARLVPLHLNAYAELAHWLRDTLARLPEAKPPVWQNFLTHSNLDEGGARHAIAIDADPVLFVEEMPSAIYGKFDPKSKNVVRIASHLVTPLKATPGDASVLQRLEATVLHELVHWAWRERSEPEEMGDAFERVAYGSPSTLEPALLRTQIPRELGGLSKRYESRGSAAAIGRDNTGGWSYGTYQIASRTGTLRAFLDYLARTEPYRAFGTSLLLAGGEAAALRGDAQFVQTWKQLADDDDFSRAQHDFIQATHYEPYLRAVRAATAMALDLTNRSHALKDVAWSVSVQHGAGATGLLVRPWTALAPADRNDDYKLIQGIYADRMRVDVHFKNSTAQVRSSVLNRFEREREDALAMLASERIA